MDWRSLLLFCFIGIALADKPGLRPPQLSVEKSLNDSYVVSCTAAVKEEVTWTGPKGQIIPSLIGRIHVENKGEKIGYALLIDRIEIGDRGRYTCTSSTKDSVSFDLTVVRTSQFVNTPTVHRVNEFQNTVIRCEVEGEPKPHITWSWNGISVGSLNSSTPPKFVVESKGLKVLNASKSDAGLYTCTAFQVGKDDGFIESVNITLKVQHKPEWKEPVSGNVMVFGYVSGESNLTCEAIAQPEANYTWFRNNKEIKAHKLNATEIKEHDRSVLQILIQDEAVFGHYQCKAKNHLGTISKTFQLQKGDKPEPPTVVQVSDVTPHTAILRIISNVPDLMGYRVQFFYSPPGHEITWDHPEYQDLQKNDSEHYEIRDLLEDTPYTVRVAARGPAGLSDFTTDTQTLRTLKIGAVRDSSERTTCGRLSLFIIVTTLCVVH